MDRKFRVVALGAVNAGKSSVLSALADTAQAFPSDSTPGTTCAVQALRVGPLELVDTPGLDINDRIDETALRAATTADTVLWCHSARQGEMRAGQLDALRRYEARLGFMRRVCFVLTHGDDLVGERTLELITSKLSEQFKSAFGITFRPVGDLGGQGRPFNVLGIELYWAARQREISKPAVMMKTGVPRLRSHLYGLAEKRGITV